MTPRSGAGTPTVPQVDARTLPLAHLDWSGRKGAPLAHNGQMDPENPCMHCRRPALLRDPVTGEPRHKVCAERELARTAAAHGGEL